MKTVIGLLLAIAIEHWACMGQRLTETQTLLRVDLNHDGVFDWEAANYVRRLDAGTLEESYDVSCVFQPGKMALSRPLRASASSIDFEPGQFITEATEIHPDDRVLLLAYGWTPLEGIVRDYAGVCRYQTSALIGARFMDPKTQDIVMGWLKFSRPSMAPGTAFTLEAWAYNPISNEPIRAGFPPDLPEPQFTFSGENLENLEVSWPAKASLLRLETTDSLSPPVQWKPVDTGGTTAITLPAGAAQGTFFRLVAPEL
jgi:hypothetical protein